MQFGDLVRRSLNARRAAHESLARHESSASRIVLLEDLAKTLSGAPIDVQDYFKEAISCLEGKLYRSAVVVAWAGHFHVLSETLFQKREAAIRTARPKWTFNDLAELKEGRSESHLIILAKDVRLISKAHCRILDGQLSERNQCAHPTLYRPSMNAAIGFVDAMIRQTLSCLGEQSSLPASLEDAAGQRRSSAAAA
jgi:hypothetical protein